MSPNDKKLKEILNLSLSPTLKNLGYKKSGFNWHCIDSDVIKVVSVQLSRWNSAEEKTFTLNAGCYYRHLAEILQEDVLDRPKEYECAVRVRLPSLKYENDHWWKVNSQTEPAKIASDILEIWENYGQLWFNKNSTYKSALEHESPYRQIVFKYRLVACCLTKSAPEAAELLNNVLLDRPAFSDTISKIKKNLNLN